MMTLLRTLLVLLLLAAPVSAQTLVKLQVATTPNDSGAEVYYAQIAPHLYNGPIGAAASIQLAACTPNFLIQESIATWGGFHAEILKTPLQWEDGFIIPSKAPGLGVELNMDVVRAHSPYPGERLHLQMAPTPADVRDFSPAKG